MIPWNNCSSFAGLLCKSDEHQHGRPGYSLHAAVPGGVFKKPSAPGQSATGCRDETPDTGRLEDRCLATTGTVVPEKSEGQPGPSKCCWKSICEGFVGRLPEIPAGHLIIESRWMA